MLAIRALRGVVRVLSNCLLGTVGLAVVIIPVGPWLIQEAPLESPDAILSLGSHEHERFPETAAQARRWPSAQVLITEPREVSPYNCDACGERVEWLISLGIERSRISVLAPAVENTRDELGRAAEWMRSRGARRLLVVTSPYHTRRVLALAASQDHGILTGVVASPSPETLPRPWWRHKYGRWYVTYEVAALAAAWWRDGTRPWRRSSPDAHRLSEAAQASSIQVAHSR